MCSDGSLGRPFFQVEGATGLAGQPFPQVRLAKQGGIFDPEHSVHRFMDALDGLAVYNLERAAQGFVARDQLLECGFKRRQVQIAADADGARYVERNLFGQQLAQEPQRLLPVGKRALDRRLPGNRKGQFLRRGRRIQALERFSGEARNRRSL